jgi:hypothetical protein
MNPSSGNPGINKLGKVLHQRMKQTNDSPLVLDFGVIQQDYGLLTNTYPIPIPKTDYMVCRDVTHNPGVPLTRTKIGQGQHPHGSSGSHGGHSSGNGTHSHPTTEGVHVHDVVLPEKMHWLKPGDRVLVAWVQNDAVVIDVVLPATRIGG